MALEVIPYREYVLEECKRRWNDFQEEEGYGSWDEQPEDVRRPFYEDMYDILWEDRHELDAVIIPAQPEPDAWDKLTQTGLIEEG